MEKEAQETPPTLLIVGATGTVGREVVRALSGKEVRLRALTRNAEASFPDGVQCVVGDLSSPQLPSRVLDGVNAALYVSPHHEDELEWGKRFAEECLKRDVSLVFLGSHVDGPNRLVRWLLRGLVGLMIPRFKRKFALSEWIRQHIPGSSIVLPTHFFQNDEVTPVRRRLLDEQNYVLPLGSKPVNRVDCADLARAISRLLLGEVPRPVVLNALGPASLTVKDCAGAWEKVLGRPFSVSTGEVDLEGELQKELTLYKTKDFMDSHALLRKAGLPTNKKHLEFFEEILGRPPGTYEEYVSRIQTTWG